MIRPRAGLLVPYVPFYEGIVSLRAEKEAFARSVAAILGEFAEVCSSGLVCSEEEARKAGAEFAAAEVDAVVVVPSVAVFGALPLAAVENLDLPVAIWNLQPASGIPEDYDIRSLIRNSGGLGVQALANTLAREGRHFEVMFSAERESVPEKLIRLLRVAAVAARLRRARFGRIGSVFPQMTDVVMDTAAWPGAAVVDVPPQDIAMSFREAPDSDVAARIVEIRQYAVVAISEDELARSARISVALDALVERHQLDGGAFNCHGENCLRNPDIGVVACYGVSRQTSEGKPFSCTGDLPTGIALWIMRQLAGAVVYGELDLVDRVHDIVLLANGGEGDFAAAHGEVTIAGNENFEGLHGRGASLRFAIAPGPATIVSFTPMGVGYRLVIGEGEILEKRLPHLGVFHAAFRFRGVRADCAFERWCEAGAVHHIAIAPGQWKAELARIARFSNFESIAIGGSDEA
jgi:L-arabinose isomerase